MMMTCSLLMETRSAMMQSLQAIGGATLSIFPQVEALLLGGDDYQRALEYVGPRKRANGYHSMIDFLFCELHPEWRIPCRRFYADNGPALKDVITAEQLVKFNGRMLKALEVAHNLHREKLRKSWGWYLKQVEEALKIAA